jgi:glycosyltransferase involved in cell wall biosynthesis
MQRAAILFSDFGPYHVARIEALGTALVVEGIELVAFRFTERSATYGWQPVVPRGMETVTLAEGAPQGARESLRAAVKFYRTLHGRRVGAVFLPTYSPLPNLLCFLAAKAAGCKTVLMTESWRATEGASLPGRLIKHLLVRMFDSALVGGSPQHDYVVAYGMPREKVFTGYDVVDNDFFTSRADEVRELTKKSSQFSAGSVQQEQTSDEVRSMERGAGSVEGGTRAEAGDLNRSGAEIAQGKPEVGQTEALIRSLPERFFLNLGRFVEKKNLAALISAYARYAQGVSVAGTKSKVKAPNSDGAAESSRQPIGKPAATKGRSGTAALVLVGEGPLREDLEKQARELGLSVRDGVTDPVALGGAEVVFYPFQQSDTTPLFFALCEAFVLPSKREEWGLVVNEAMACSAPVIVSDCVGSSFDLVQDGLNGFRFVPADVNTLAGLLGQVADDPELRARLGAAGRRRIEDWTTARFGREGLKALRAALNQPDGPPSTSA